MTTRSNNTDKTVFKIVAIALSLLLIMLILALAINLVKLGAENERKRSLETQEEKLEQLINKNDNLIEYCQSSEFVEEYAREYLDMIYRGETPVGGK